MLVDADLSSANSSPFGPLQPELRADCLRLVLGSSHESTDFFELTQNGRDLELRWATRIEQPLPNLGLRGLLFLHVDL